MNLSYNLRFGVMYFKLLVTGLFDKKCCWQAILYRDHFWTGKRSKDCFVNNIQKLFTFCRQNGNVTNISVVSNHDSLTEQKSNKKLEKCIPNVIQSFRIPDKNLSLIFKWPAILTDRVILYSYLCILFKNYWISLSLFLIKKFLSLNEYFLASIRVLRTAQSIFWAFFVRASSLILKKCWFLFISQS